MNSDLENLQPESGPEVRIAIDIPGWDPVSKSMMIHLEQAR